MMFPYQPHARIERSHKPVSDKPLVLLRGSDFLNPVLEADVFDRDFGFAQYGVVRVSLNRRVRFDVFRFKFGHLIEEVVDLTFRQIVSVQKFFPVHIMSVYVFTIYKNSVQRYALFLKLTNDSPTFFGKCLKWGRCCRRNQSQ